MLISMRLPLKKKKEKKRKKKGGRGEFILVKGRRLKKKVDLCENLQHFVG